MKTVILMLGVAVTIMGLLRVGQELGLIGWPETSFMLGSEQWAGHGSLVSISGLALILLSRSIGHRT